MTVFDVGYGSPSGVMRCIACDATGHLHTTPDVLLSIFCPLHNKEWQWCPACLKIYCPGEPGRNSSHPGTVVNATE